MRTLFLALIVLIVVNNVVAQNVLQVFSLSGHGSSSVANVLAGEWKIESAFAEHDGAYAGSNSLQSKSDGSTTMVNMKGFGGPSGDNSDEASLNAIVMHAKEIGHINGLLLVVNGEDMALSSLTGLLQMYVDTFGSEMVNQLGVVITRSFLIDDEKIAAFRHELDAVLSDLTGRPVQDTPVWLMETRMDRLEARSLPDSVVQEARNNLAVVAGEIKEWLEQQPALDVAHVVAAPHPHHRKVIGAKEKPLQLDSDSGQKGFLKALQWAAEDNPHYRKVSEAMEKLQLANDIFHKETLKATQRAEEGQLVMMTKVRVIAAAEAKNCHEKAQVIAARAGEGLSQYECVAILTTATIFKTATFVLSYVVPNASKGIDNVAKDFLKMGT